MRGVRDGLSEKILKEIARLLELRPGSRAALPPERELARRLGTSRVTVRQALGVLQRWGVVEPRQGSGVKVCDLAEWSFAALPTLLSARGPGAPALEALRPWVVEALALRRSFARRAPAELAGRLAPGALATAGRRAAEAWAERGSAERFVRLDAAVLRAAFEAAGATASAWLWNDLSRVPRALAASHAAPAPVAADYEARQAKLREALEAGDVPRAEHLIGAHLARLDRGLLAGFPGEAVEGATR
jgi:DNA-binding FadR family transcriptional regulator